MYIISTILKPGIYWWIYLCEVYEVLMQDGKKQCLNITHGMAERLWLTYKKNVIQISFWSWTWFNVLKGLIEKYTGCKYIFNVSVQM